MKKNILLSSTLLLLVPCFSLPMTGVYASANAKEGVLSTQHVIRVAEKPIKEKISTLEAWIKLDSSISGRGGVVFGSYCHGYSGDHGAGINFEIYSNGNPRLYYHYGRKADKSGEDTKDFVFTNCDVRKSDDWTHLAIVNDTKNSKIFCYLDGQLKQTINDQANIPSSIYPFVAGGDNRGNATNVDGLNDQYFKGSISSIATFSDVRSASQIATDMGTIDDNDSNLITHYEFGGKEDNKLILNQKVDGNHNYDLKKLKRDWLSEEELPDLPEYAFSIPVIGDIQAISELRRDELHHIFDYIIKEREEQKIKLVIETGDTVQHFDDSELSPLEWSNARQQFARFDKINIPYSINRGNHDASSYFNEYFNDGVYTAQMDGFYSKDKVEDCYKLMTINKTKYLLLTLDYGPSYAVLDWANNIINRYKDYKVIVNTHAFLNADGEILTASGPDSPHNTGGVTTCVQMWDYCFKKHSNIETIICGHITNDNIVVSQMKGDKGNTVTQVLVNPQYMDVSRTFGMVLMLYFSEDGSVVNTRYYSTTLNKYYSEEGIKRLTLFSPANFSINLNISNSATVDFVNHVTRIGDMTYFDVNPKENYIISSVTANGIKLKSISKSGKSFAFVAQENNNIQVYMEERK